MGKKNYLGIDLGTTYSVAAYINDQGEAETVLNSENTNITPSVVYIEGENSFVVGQPAKDLACIYPNEVISLVKNSMGRKDENGQPIVFETKYGIFKPEVISAQILRDIVDDANSYLHLEDNPITDVVVTVPAYFEVPHRKATDDAISIAGLKRIDFINEPTAAALYYANKSNLQTANVMVYDLGGGTFDVTIINIDGEKIEVKATGGLSKVGGSYFDKEIASKVYAFFEQKHGIDLSKPEYADARQDILTKVERAKIQLSKTQSADIVVRVDSVSEKFTLTREDLNTIVAELYRRTENLMKKVLKDAELTIEDIDRLILVGGSSRIPYVVDRVREFYGKEPSQEVNPNEVVALGAAIFAKRRMEGEEKNIIDVCSHGIGIKAADPKTGKLYNDIIIKRNSKLPVSVEKVYELQDEFGIIINVLEGDYKEIADVTQICEVNVSLPENMKKGTLVYIRLEMDVNQLLHIYLRIPDAGNVEKEITFQRNGNMSEAEVGQWKQSLRKASEIRAAEKDESKKGQSLFGRIAAKLSGDEQPEAEAEAVPVSTEPTAEDKEKEKHDKWLKTIPKSVLGVMEDVIGMDEVREAMRDYKNRVAMDDKRTFMGKISDDTRDIAILGKPGIGVSTAAGVVAQCLYKMGIVSKEDPVWATYDDIVKEDEQKTTEAISNLFTNAENGILIIDDFERFYNDNSGAAGMQAIPMIQKASVTAGNKVILIISGYHNEISKIFEENEKFSRQFMSHTIELVGYDAAEYVKIMHSIATRDGYVIDDYADEKLKKHLKGAIRMPNFHGVHYLDEVLDEAKTVVANRAATLRHAKDSDYQIIRSDDFALAEGEKSLDELLEELNAMVGLDSVKKKVNELVNINQFNQKAIAAGEYVPDEAVTRHMVFYGNPGTGKTTVARLISEIFRELGLLTRGHLVETRREELVSQYVGQTAILVADKVKEAMGGVLFIDEAYLLYKDDNDSFGKEAIETLLKYLEDNRDDFICIIAGYTREMNDFLSVNPGLPSRFPEQNRINFEDYSLDDLMEIFNRTLSSKGLLMEGKAEDTVKKILANKKKSPRFGNAREVRNLFEAIRSKQKSRLAATENWGDDETKIIRLEDITDETGDSDENIKKVLEEIDSMVGLTEVKKEIHGLVDLVRNNKELEKRGIAPANSGTLHCIFEGHAGTGKTTVAEMLGKIYKELGLLSTGKVFTETKATIVKGYVGQTPDNVRKILDLATGGILFIDEAYQLNDGQFGQEAIDTLVAELDARRDSLMCIIAGYDNDMEKFLDANEGLKSRFKNVIHFADYTIDEKVTIFENMAVNSKQHYILGEGTLDTVRAYLEEGGHPECDGNARGVRNLFENAVRHLSTRNVKDYSPDKSNEELLTILPEDVSADVKPGAKAESLEDILNELDSMIGLESVKAQVKSLVALQQANMERARRNLPIQSKPTLHMVFSGSPGTGKTTVARIIARLYKALGVLPTDKTIETDRGHLVGQYVGQTAPKVDAEVQRALGGVLFIDEAYLLLSDDFGKEAINELVALTENYRDDFVCIVAGYEGPMREFLACNEGLESRFTNFIDFEDYTVDEKLRIFESVATGKSYGLKLGEGTIDAVREYFNDSNKKYVNGNGRGVRNLVQKASGHLNNRMFGEKLKTATDEELITLLPEDISAIE